MVEPRHKLKEVKTKTIIDRLKGSALFILLFVLVLLVDILLFIAWISILLSGTESGDALWKGGISRTFYGLTAAILLYWGLATLIQRAAHGTSGSSHKH
jgi:hypothetical protein